MPDGIKYWIVFVQGVDEQGKILWLPMTYSGRKVLWDYFIENITEEHNLRSVQVNGYVEISEQKYKELHFEDE